MVVSHTLRSHYAAAMQAAFRGERHHKTPPTRTPLASAERLVLRYVARGWSNRFIASYLSLQEKTVLNTLTNVYQKLGFHSRTEATLHDWGVYHQFGMPALP